MNTKSCEYGDCRLEAVEEEKYCGLHRREIIKQLERVGYLRPVPRVAWNENSVDAGKTPKSATLIA